MFTYHKYNSFLIGFFVVVVLYFFSHTLKHAELPQPGTDPTPLTLCGSTVLTIGPPGKSSDLFIKKKKKERKEV